MPLRMRSEVKNCTGRFWLTKQTAFPNVYLLLYSRTLSSPFARLFVCLFWIIKSTHQLINSKLGNFTLKFLPRKTIYFVLVYTQSAARSIRKLKINKIDKNNNKKANLRNIVADSQTETLKAIEFFFGKLFSKRRKKRNFNET